MSLRLPWAKRSLGFQPVAPDGPIVPDFFTSNWTPYLYVAKIHIFAEKTNDLGTKNSFYLQNNCFSINSSMIVRNFADASP